MTDQKGGAGAEQSKKVPVIPLFPWLANCAKRYFRERKAQKQTENTEQRSIRVSAEATVVIAFFAVVAAFIAASQAFIGNRTLDEIRSEQRPVIWTGNDVGTPKLFTNPQTNLGQVLWTVHYTNSGKGFVKGGMSKSYIKIGQGNFEQTFQQKAIGKAIPPMAPNQDLFETAISKPGIKPEDFSQWQTKEDEFFVKFIFVYFDLAGVRYESGFCLKKLVSGAISYCPENNYVK